MRAPALLIAFPLAVGAGASILYFEAMGPETRAAFAAAALVALVAATGATLADDRVLAMGLIACGAGLAGVSLGRTAAERAYSPPLLRWFEARPRGDPVLLEGVLREDASPSSSGISLVVDVRVVVGLRGEESLGGVRLSVGGLLSAPARLEWRAGRRIRAPATLRLPSVYLNPGVADDRRALARRGIVLVGSVKSAALVEVLERGGVISESAGAVRAAIRRRVANAMRASDPKSPGIATAVLIGDRSALDREDERRLQDAGTYHVLAISGGNIAVLAMLMVAAGRLFLLPRRATMLATAATLAFYAVIAAGSPSVGRAVTVAVILLAGHALEQRGPPLNAVAVAATTAMVMSTVVVLDVAFILSFGATVGILLGVPLVVRHRVGERRRTWRARARHASLPVVGLLAATLCAELVLAPVGALAFGRVPVAGVLLNFAAIPLMTIVQVSGIVLVAADGWWPDVASIAARAADLAAVALLRSAHVVDVAPWLALDVRPPAAWLMAAYYAGAGALMAARTRRIAGVVLAAAASVMIVGPRWAVRDAVPTPRWPLRIVFLDVGQGDATVVMLPGGAALLVDAGGVGGLSPPMGEGPPAFDVGERVVVPALRALGVSRLYAIVLTHGDPDHVLGVSGVFRRVRVGGVWEGVPVPSHALLTAISRLAVEKGLPWRTVQAGDLERFGEVAIRVLHPPPPDWERQRVRNEDSIVLELRIGQVSILLPGDIGSEGEAAIASRLETGRLVVLKAPHHGSATSSSEALLKLLRPAAVIFSCGRDNRFGHPHPAVRARYAAIGSAMFSTAEHGAVFVDTDGASIEVRGWSRAMGAFTQPGGG